MGRLDNKIAFITGAARGQGRSHAVRLAEEGAAIIAVDICAQIDSVPYEMGSADDLAVTVKEVEAVGGRIHAGHADVRDVAGLRAAFEAGVAALGPVDIVIANAGIMTLSLDESATAWQDVIDVNLTGVFNTVEIALPSMVARGAGGSVVITSSAAGLLGIGGPSQGGLGYTAAKHGLVGLMRSYANSYAKHSIRVNTVHPTGVSTPMVDNDNMKAVFDADPTVFTDNALPVRRVESIDVSNAITWLVSDEGRYVTGVTLPVDAGFANKK
jgi:SDR family mycofactocin-dependent oxidoreductase